MLQPAAVHCPACGAPHALSDCFCGQCGSRLPPCCAGCGMTLTSGQRFCTHCGRAADVTQSADATDTAGPAVENDGERRHATIVFSDLSGYTSLNEQFDAEDVSLVVAELRELATGIVESHGGVVNQFVGDEIMALFGVPQASRDDALRALQAALELQRATRALSERPAYRLGVRLDLHTGINSGLVVVRPCAPHQGRHGLTGDAVNVAARLLKLAQAGEVIVGDDTWRMVSSHFEGDRLPPTPVRGKSLAVQPWRVLREVAMPPAATLIGRDDELRHARATLQACIEGQAARWLLIRGEPGIGKSRLLGEVVDLATAAGAALITAAVPDFGPARGDIAVRALIQGLLQTPPGAGESAVQARLAEAGLPEARQAHVHALLGRDVPGQARAAYASLDSAARERGNAEALVALLRHRSESMTVLLAIEDLHWAEASTLTLLARVIAGCRDRPVLLLLTARPQSEGLEAARRAHAGGIPALTLDLSPLEDDDAEKLARLLAHNAPEVVQRCVARAGGNPLFLEQLLRSAGEALREALPGSIQSLVLARLDRLTPTDKAAVQAASVLGQRVELDVWRSLADHPRIEPLIDAGLLRPDGDAAQFVHALVRDGAYASLLKTRRRELHLRAANWYASRNAGLHAEHLAIAESPLAAAAFAQAARVEATRCRYAEALAYTDRGLACALTADERHALAMLRGETLRELGRNAEALEAFDMARDAAANDRDMALASYELATVYRLLAQVDAAWRALDIAEPVAQRLGETRWLSGIQYLRGNLCFARGDSAGCAARHGEALSLALACGDALAQAQALSGLGDAHYAEGRMHSALDAFKRCVAACERSGALRFAVMNRAMVGWCCYWHGHADDCREHLRAAGEAAVALSHRNAEAMVTESLGLMLDWMGDPEGRPTLERAVRLSHEVGMKRFEMVSRAGLARSLRCSRLREQALDMARDAWQLCIEVGGQAFAGPLVLIEIAFNTLDPDEAESALRQVQAILEQGAVAHNYLFALPDAMRLRLAQARLEEVLRLADQLEAYAREEPNLWVTHHVAAARALVRAAGPRSTPGVDLDDALRREINRLLGEARDARLFQSAQELEAALRVP
jgi:class 3 adenylate cyclase/tetratricopeptide (TPR) repeat protein